MWELLLVDDGSTDGSTAIAKEYAERYPQQVCYLEHEGHQNRGQAASRNLGVRYSKGEYLAFLDADDIWLPRKLEQQLALLESQPQAGMLYGLSRWWYSWMDHPGEGQGDYVYQLGVPAGVMLEPQLSLANFFVKQTATVPNPSSIMIRRTVVDSVGGFQENFRGIYSSYEDQAFYAKVGLAFPILPYEDCWDYYRQHPNSVCSVVEKEGRDVEARLFFLDWLVGYIEKKGLEGTPIWHSLRREIWLYRHPAVGELLRGGRALMKKIKDVLWQVTPAPLRTRIWAWLHNQAYIPPVDHVRFGDLRRLVPFTRDFGYERGGPVDRYYIEKFLSDHRNDVRGRALEIADNNYTIRFGEDRVTQSDILHVAPGDPKATITGDLATADHIPDNSFDCIILTQTIQVVYDVRAVIKTVYRILKPGGVVLVTGPGISQISRYDMDRWGYYWSFTSLSLRKLFSEIFPDDHVQTRSYGNVLTAAAFLYGMGARELKQQELEFFDPDYEVTIGVRAMKPQE